MDITVVIPTYNEALAIRENAQKLISALQKSGRSWELIFVNDGSTDETLPILKDVAAENAGVRIVSYSKNRGRGHALRKGFEAAHGAYIIATESDLNWGSDIIGRFVEELDRGEADIVVASPHMPGGRMENVPFARWFLSYWGNKVFSLALPGHMTMATGMTRGYRREVLDSLELDSDGKELHVEILTKAFDLGYRVKEIPALLKWKAAQPGVPVRKSHFKLRSIIRHLVMSFDVRPYLFFGFIGMLCVGIGAVLGLYLLKLSLSGLAVAGRPMLFAAVLFIVTGFQILLFGLLASQGRDTKRELIKIQRTLKKRQ